jgi:hypothetical protein
VADESRAPVNRNLAHDPSHGVDLVGFGSQFRGEDIGLGSTGKGEAQDNRDYQVVLHR